ncbi:MAG: hypothetical protein FJ091_09205 [Deltaproteobacteria bacterium]|nr:hypothetical protein [Deltaproteobacteria bacterium]
MLRILVIVFLLVLAAVLGAAAWLGAFARIAVEEREVGPHRFVYRTMIGADPQQVGAITDEIARALDAAGITQRQPLDLFYPAGAREPNEIGWAIGDGDAAKLAALDSSLRQRTIPAAPSLVVEFPWKHPASFVVGYFKVVPALELHREAHGYQDAASYTLNLGDTILYVQPIVK